MQSTSIFLCFLFLLNTFAVELRSKSKIMASSDLSSQISRLDQSPLGSMIRSLAELHAMTGGPIEELTQAITDLLQDLEEKVSSENSLWDSTTALHNSKVDHFNAEIQGAQEDIASAHQKLNDVLYPERTLTENTIANKKERINENQDTTTRESAERDRQHRDFLEKQDEHTQGLAAVNEAIELVQSLVNTTPSLLQIKNVKSAMGKINKKVGKRVAYAPIIKALTQLVMEQNFSDQATVEKILDLLKRLRDNLTSSLGEYTETERQQSEAWDKRSKQLADELAQLQSDLKDAENHLEELNGKIDNEEKFLEKRTLDLKSYQDVLELENENYAKLQATHEDLIKEFEREHGIIEEAINLLSGIQARDYLKARANQE